MAVSMKQVRAYLDCEEPDYPAAAEALGSGAAPHLARLVEEADPLLASKAAYLASLIGTEKAAGVVAAAAQHVDPTVRIASAAGARNLDAARAEPALEGLLDDTDPGVRKAALNAVGVSAGESLQARVEAMLRDETDRSLRAVTRDAVARMRGENASYAAPEDGEAEDEPPDGFGGGDLPEAPATRSRGSAAGEEDGAGFGGGEDDAIATRSGPADDTSADGVGQGGGEDAPGSRAMGDGDIEDAAGMGGGG